MKIKWNSEQIPKMNVKNNKDVTFLTYPAYEEMNWLVHGFSTRFGGVSRGIYSSMNLSFTRGDEESCVKENYRRISDAMGFDMNSIVTSDQTHTNNVRKVTEKDRGKGIVIPRDYTDTDGMITNVPGLVLATFYAVTIEKMSEEYGSNPKDLKVAIGPSICQECYEVSEDVIEEFEKVFDKKYRNRLFYRKENGKYQLNLWMANKIIFLEAGIPEENISMPNLCTCCNPEFLFSHRASHGKRGNLGAFLGIRS